MLGTTIKIYLPSSLALGGGVIRKDKSYNDSSGSTPKMKTVQNLELKVRYFPPVSGFAFSTQYIASNSREM
jgi:hypothetical protein